MSERKFSPADNLAEATGSLLECLAEFGAEAHRYCGEHVGFVQEALERYQQSVCEHQPESLPGFEGKWCVKCGVRILDNVRLESISIGEDGLGYVVSIRSGEPDLQMDSINLPAPYPSLKIDPKLPIGEAHIGNVRITGLQTEAVGRDATAEEMINVVIPCTHPNMRYVPHDPGESRGICPDCGKRFAVYENNRLEELP